MIGGGKKKQSLSTARAAVPLHVRTVSAEVKTLGQKGATSVMDAGSVAVHKAEIGRAHV